jgi:hypothetical protein
MFEDEKLDLSIRDAGLACETLLNIWYHKHYGKLPDRKTFGPLLEELREIIQSDLGTLTYSDLEFIKDWRNKIEHPQPDNYTLDKKTALQVLARSETFSSALSRLLNPFKP